MKKTKKKKRNNLVRVVRKGSGAISRAEIDGGKMPLWSREFVLLRTASHKTLQNQANVIYTLPAAILMLGCLLTCKNSNPKF